MSILAAVRTVLIADAAVLATVASRVWPVELPQQGTLPAIVLHLVSTMDGRHLLGSNRYPVGRFIVDCIASNFADADTLGDDVMAALVDYRGTVGTTRIDDIGHDDLDFYDKGERGEHWRRRIGFRARYRIVETVDD